MIPLKNDANRIETEFINEWARHQPMDLKVVVESVGLLGTEFPDLADVVHVLRTGYVRVSDMSDRRGLWTIVGETTDNHVLELEIVVASERCEVELRSVTVLKRSEL